jgi:hypothetical protein
MIFKQTGAETEGELLQIECYSLPTAAKEPEHVQPLRESRVEILAGACKLSMNSKETTAHYIQNFRPALHIDGILEIFFALAREGKLNRKGISDHPSAS